VDGRILKRGRFNSSSSENQVGGSVGTPIGAGDRRSENSSDGSLPGIKAIELARDGSGFDQMHDGGPHKPKDPGCVIYSDVRCLGAWRARSAGWT
jgi:hypothetical protein